jgi:hypothetical protein
MKARPASEQGAGAAIAHEAAWMRATVPRPFICIQLLPSDRFDSIISIQYLNPQLLGQGLGTPGLRTRAAASRWRQSSKWQLPAAH